jgi:DNA-binding PadR family transcriptional regulator
MSKIELDPIDVDLLEEVNQNSGQPLKSAIVPLIGRRDERTLYDRLKALALHGFISVDRSEKNYSLATITAKGKAAIRGRENRPSISEASS